MHEYASVSWRPEADERAYTGNRTTSKVVKRRGLSFEEFMMSPKDFRNVSDFYGHGMFKEDYD